MILMHFGFGLMTAAAVTAIILNFKLSKKNKSLKGTIDATANALAGTSLCAVDLQQLSNKETFMEERAEPIPHFAIYRKGLTGKIDLLQIGYNADVPDDREYKRIFAQERVDALNEKP